jgi:hypothetical protein
MIETCQKEFSCVIRERIELPTFRVLGGRDNQIHHRTRTDDERREFS